MTVHFGEKRYTPGQESLSLLSFAECACAVRLGTAFRRTYLFDQIGNFFARFGQRIGGAGVTDQHGLNCFA